MAVGGQVCSAPGPCAKRSMEAIQFWGALCRASMLLFHFRHPVICPLSLQHHCHHKHPMMRGGRRSCSSDRGKSKTWQAVQCNVKFSATNAAPRQKFVQLFQAPRRKGQRLGNQRQRSVHRSHLHLCDYKPGKPGLESVRILNGDRSEASPR